MFFKFFLSVFKVFSVKERVVFFSCLFVFFLALFFRVALAIADHSDFVPIHGGSYREGVVGQSTFLNPVISAHPIDRDIMEMVFSPLSRLLAGYEVLQDGKEYILKLKEGLVWDDGQPLTSDDVVFTIRTIQDPDIQSPFSSSWRGSLVERLSELQVRIILPAPYVFFSSIFGELRIIPRHIFGSLPPARLALSSYNLEPVGNGPYRVQGFTKRKDGFVTSYHLVPNERYHDAAPYIQDFYFNFFSSEPELFDAFRFHKIDGFASSVPLPQDKLELLSNAVVTSIPSSRYYAAFFNGSTHSALADSEIRKALSLAINRQALVKTVLNGNGQALISPVMRMRDDVNAWEDSGVSEAFNPQLARDIIQNRLKGEDLVFTLTFPDVPFLEETARFLREAWIAIGVTDVRFDRASSQAYLQHILANRSYDILLFGNTYEHLYDFFPFWHSAQKDHPGFNFSLYSQPQVDSLIETIRRLSSESERDSLILQIQDNILRDVPAAVLFSMPYFYVHTDALGGLYFSLPGVFFSTIAQRFSRVSSWYVSTIRVLQ